MTQLTDKYFSVEVPGDAVDIGIYNYGLNDAIEYMHDIEGVAAYDVDDLPPGSYRFLFTTKAATEEEARKVVESEELFINGNSQGIYYCNYLVPHDVCEWYKHWLNSLRSLLQSKGLDPKNNYALIEKLK